jgi:hypothetical protein
MKALFYILVFTAVIFNSCTNSLYVGREYDDLYYSPSDKPTVSVQKNVPEQIAEENQRPEQYYDNAYSNDTLVADGYNDAVDFNNSMYYNKDNSPFEYADDFSYSNRLRRFYGNYFDPYMDDSFNYGYGYPSMGFGYGYPSMGFGYGYPYMGGGMYDPFYYGGGYYGDNFGGYYSNYYGGFYGSFFSPFYYGGYGYYPGSYYYSSKEYSSLPIARRQRYSTLSNNYNQVSPSKKSGNSFNGVSRRSEGSSQNSTSETRSISSNSRQSTTTLPENKYGQQGVQTRRDAINSSNNISSSPKPEYKSANRTYTPSYNSPRINARPSYNNSRTNSNTVQNSSRNNNGSISRGSNYAGYNSGNSNSGKGSSSSTLNRLRSMIYVPSRSQNYPVPPRSTDRSSGYSSERNYSNSSSGNSGRSSSGYTESVRSSSGSSSFSGGSSSSSVSSGSSGSSSTRRK